MSESYATPTGNPKPKVKVPASAPGRTGKSKKSGTSKKKRTSSLSPVPASTDKMKKTKSKKKKKEPGYEDNWSISSEEENGKSNDLKSFKEFSQNLPGPPLAKKSNSTKKGLRDEKLPRKESTKTAMSNGDTSAPTPVSKEKSNVGNTSPSPSRRQSVPTPATPNGILKSPGQLKRRAGSARSPAPLSRGSSRRGSVNTPPQSPVGSSSAYRSPKTPIRRSVGGPPLATTPRASSSKSPMRSTSVASSMSPKRRSQSPGALTPATSKSARRSQIPVPNSPRGGLPVAPLTPRGGLRSEMVPQTQFLDDSSRKSPGSLSSERYSIAASSTRIITPRTPKSPARRSVLGGRRATTGLADEDLKKLEIAPLDDDAKKGAGDGSSPGEEGGEEEEVVVVKRKPYPKTDEEWEEFDAPPKSLVIVWVVVMGELVFDMGTTMIAFRALGEESECCGSPVTVGSFPMLITTPFFLLVSSEIALLLRAILLTMWPDMMKPINLSYLDSDAESDAEDEGEANKEALEYGEDLKREGAAKKSVEDNIDVCDEDKEQATSDDKEQATPVNNDEKKLEHEEPSDRNTEEDDKKQILNKQVKRRLKRRFLKYCCCWLQWKARMLMHVLDFMVLLNPFFGCFIAWVLMYQSDKNDAFVVLGFEAASLVLHYISVYIEGGISNAFEFFMQGLLPLIPFTVAISLVLYYLKQGGVCYLVEDRVFKFSGCEVCIDGYPPVDGICYLKDGTNYTFVATDLLDVESYNTVDDLLSRTNQVSYCAAQNPSGPDTNFCFFDFELGQLDGLVIEATEAPTRLPALSSSKCGATVGPGPWETSCRMYLWNPTQDESMFCFAFGGAGDPCHLNIVHDGVNYGRFKDPSSCRLQLRPDGDYFSRGDVFYLWDDPSLYGFDFRWAANAWLAYSLTRWVDQVELLRKAGLKVTTPLVTFQDEAQVVRQLSEFFDTCSPHCDDPESNAYIDLLAVNVFCDPSTETCADKVAAVTNSLKGLSSQYGDRPVHITQWGVRDSSDPPVLLSAMDSTPGFFTDGSTIERVYWYGGDSPTTTNLRIQARQSRLGLIWAQTCASIDSNNSL